jgi:hypothetical protein
VSLWSLSDDEADLCARTIARDEAHAVLWHYFPRTPGLMEPGSFRQALIAAAVRADPQNLARLAIGFPGIAAAVALVANRDDGAARVAAIAGITLPAGEPT